MCFPLPEEIINVKRRQKIESRRAGSMKHLRSTAFQLALLVPVLVPGVVTVRQTTQALHQVRQQRCRCISSSARCWPKASVWQAFNQTVQGRLARSVDEVAACFGAVRANAFCIDAAVSPLSTSARRVVLQRQYLLAIVRCLTAETRLSSFFCFGGFLCTYIQSMHRQMLSR